MSLCGPANQFLSIARRLLSGISLLSCCVTFRYQSIDIIVTSAVQKATTTTKSLRFREGMLGFRLIETFWPRQRVGGDRKGMKERAEQPKDVSRQPET
jgi:hypothetical protein